LGGCVKGLGAHIGSCIRLSGSFWALSGLSVVFCYPLCGWLEPLESWFMGILCCLWTQWWLHNSIIILLTNIYNIILFVFLIVVQWRKWLKCQLLIWTLMKVGNILLLLFGFFSAKYSWQTVSNIGCSYLAHAQNDLFNNN